jgi:YqaJ-like viral recombinase domain
MKVHDVKQGSPEWLNLRLGIPTASEFDALVTPEWKIKTGAGPQTYLYQKICEKSMGFALDTGSGFSMENGSILEHEALPWFEFAHDINAQRVGFCTTDDGRIGCSPDGLIGEDGGIEIKCPRPDTHLRYLLQGGVPKDYLAQVHGSMLVTGRSWWNFLSYSRQFPALLVRVERDEAIIATMREALAGFLKQFDAGLARITELKAAARGPQTGSRAAA